MKKKLLLLATFGLSLTGVAQPVLNQENFAAADENYVFSTLVDLTVDYSSTGANYTWDFSTLSTTNQRWMTTLPISEAGQMSNFYFGNFAANAYKATYFAHVTDLPIDQWTSSLPVSIDEISLFTKNTATSINSVGYEIMISGQGIPVKSDTIEHRYELPLEYGDSYESRGYTDLDLNPVSDIQWIQHRHRVSSVDGWGNVITPYGSFNALRIHHIIDEVDSFYVSLNGNGTWIPIPVPTSHTYEWRTLTEKESVMTISTSEVGGDEVVTNVEYRDNYNGLGLDNNEVTLSIYPNPVADELKFELSSNTSHVSIIDSKGKVVYQSKLEANSGSVDMTNFASGAYHAVFITESGVKSQECIKK